MAKIWGTELLIKDELLACNMISIAAPIYNEEQANKIDSFNEYIYNKYNTIFFIFKFSNNKYYARISAQIMNEIGDYEIAAKALLEYINIFNDDKNMIQDKNLECP